MMEKKKPINGKVIIVGFGLFLVAVVVASIVFLDKCPRVNGTKLSISTICSSTDYKDTCLSTLAPLYHKTNVTMYDIIHNAIGATLAEWQNVFDMYETLFMGSADYKSLMKIDQHSSNEGRDCMFLLNCTRDDLQAAMSILDDELWLKGPVPLHAAELNNLLSATISYQETCLDGIPDSELRLAMKNGIANFTQLTSNALSIVTQISNNCKTLKTLLSTNRRKLLEEEMTEVSSGRYPAWIPAASRRLLENGGGVTPDVVVAKDGSGKFRTIGEALAAYPKPNPRGRYVIYVKAGIYPEQVIVDRKMVNVTMYGDGPELTIITGWKTRQLGYSILETATFSAVGQGFIAKSMGFRNTVGPTGEHGVALRVESDLSAFFNCRMDGYQNTLFAQAYRQFYGDCIISGSKDIIFGDSATVIQNSVVIVRKPAKAHEKIAITASARADRWETTGFVLQNCSIVPDKELFPVRQDINVYLGSPMKKCARTIVMESTLGDFISPEGWMARVMNGDNNVAALDKLVFAEYSNVGPGANTSRRVKWKGYKVIKDAKEALQYTVQQFIQGPHWLMPIGEPILYNICLGWPNASHMRYAAVVENPIREYAFQSNASYCKCIIGRTI